VTPCWGAVHRSYTVPVPLPSLAAVLIEAGHCSGDGQRTVAAQTPVEEPMLGDVRHLGASAVDVRIRLGPWRRHAETEVRRLR
jgi:hypothetical protein